MRKRRYVGNVLELRPRSGRSARHCAAGACPATHARGRLPLRSRRPRRAMARLGEDIGQPAGADPHRSLASRSRDRCGVVDALRAGRARRPSRSSDIVGGGAGPSRSPRPCTRIAAAARSEAAADSTRSSSPALTGGCPGRPRRSAGASGRNRTFRSSHTSPDPRSRAGVPMAGSGCSPQYRA